MRAIQVEYEVLPHFVREERRDLAPASTPGAERTDGDPDAAFASAHRVVERTLGMPQMAHMCLEPHGQVAAWAGDELEVHASTQAVSTLGGQFASELGVPGDAGAGPHRVHGRRLRLQVLAWIAGGSSAQSWRARPARR